MKNIHQNRTRAERGCAALDRWLQVYVTGNADHEDHLVDLLTDLGHLAQQSGFNFRQLCSMALMHLDAETVKEDGA